jgi:hypothetical protein
MDYSYYLGKMRKQFTNPRAQKAQISNMQEVPTEDNADDDDDDENDEEMAEPRPKSSRAGFLITCVHRQDRKLIAVAFTISMAMIALEGVWFGTGTSTVVAIGLTLESLVYLYAIYTNREEEDKDFAEKKIGVGGWAILKSFVVLVM